MLEMPATARRKRRIRSPDCESFNGKLRDELLNGAIFYTLKEASIVIESWRRRYNKVRPHSSLGYRPPAPEALCWPASLN
jgi:putative transposase